MIQVVNRESKAESVSNAQLNRILNYYNNGFTEPLSRQDLVPKTFTNPNSTIKPLIINKK